MWEPFRQSLEQWAPNCRIVALGRHNIFKIRSHCISHSNTAPLFCLGYFHFCLAGIQFNGLLPGLSNTSAESLTL